MLSTLPVLTMLAAALLGVEALTRRKSLGVAIATGGVLATLGASVSAAPIGAWRGDLLMGAAAVCMALYNVWSRPYVARSSATTFAAFGMGVGGLALALLAWATGQLQRSVDLMGWNQVYACLYLAVFGGAVNFYLWAFALGRTTPTRVAISITVNPITASITAAMLVSEPDPLEPRGRAGGGDSRYRGRHFLTTGSRLETRDVRGGERRHPAVPLPAALPALHRLGGSAGGRVTCATGWIACLAPDPVMASAATPSSGSTAAGLPGSHRLRGSAGDRVACVRAGSLRSR